MSQSVSQSLSQFRHIIKTHKKELEVNVQSIINALILFVLISKKIHSYRGYRLCLFTSAYSALIMGRLIAGPAHQSFSIVYLAD